MRKRAFGIILGVGLLLSPCFTAFAVNVDSVEAKKPMGEEELSHDMVWLDEAAYGLRTQENTLFALFSEPVDLAEYPEYAQDITIPLAIQNVLVNGKHVDTAGLSMLGETAYMPIETLVLAVDEDAQVYWEDSTLVVEGKTFSFKARMGENYLTLPEGYLPVPDCIITDGFSLLAPVRVLCHAMNVAIDYDNQSQSIAITSTQTYYAPQDGHYNEEDLYWLSRIISSESGNQPLRGKIAVGTVIMNRVESQQFPNTIYDVIFSGIQFSPVLNGTIYNAPTEESVQAAKMVLDGTREAGKSLFFNRADLNSWASRNKTFVTTIADHSFFY